MKLVNGDCLQVMDELIAEGVKVDAIITDPPYGTTACRWDSVIPFNEMWPRLKALRKERTPVVLFGSEPFSSALRMSNIKEFKYDWIWNKVLKSGHLNAKIKPMLQHEMISVFYKHIYIPIMEHGEPLHSEGKNRKINKVDVYGRQTKQFPDRKGETKKYPSTLSIVLQKIHPAVAIHPTQKPLEVMEYLIKTYTSKGGTVLDFTMGSGTTGVACKNLGRDFIGIELDEAYFKIAESRINSA